MKKVERQSGMINENNCAVCDELTSLLSRRKIANEKYVCEGCFKKAQTLTFKQIFNVKKLTADDIRKSIIESSPSGQGFLDFKASRKISDAFQINENDKKVFLSNSNLNNPVIGYEEIVSFELQEDGETITSGGLGRAAVGGVLFGGAGAVVGAVTGGKKEKKYSTSVLIKLVLHRMDSPVAYVSLLNKKVKTNSNEYKNALNNAQEILATLQLVSNDSKATEQVQPTVSATDQIIEYKKLFDQDIITEAEFATKKKELLGL